MAKTSEPPILPLTKSDLTPPPPAYTSRDSHRVEETGSNAPPLVQNSLNGTLPVPEKVSQQAPKPVQKSQIILQPQQNTPRQQQTQQQTRPQLQLNVRGPFATTVKIKFRFKNRPHIDETHTFRAPYTVSQAVDFAVEKHPEASVTLGKLYVVSSLGSWVNTDLDLTKLGSRPTLYITDNPNLNIWRDILIVILLLLPLLALFGGITFVFVWMVKSTIEALRE